MNGKDIDITKYGFSMIQIETISSCNMACSFCGYPLRRDKESILPSDVVDNLIDSLYASDGFKHICFSQFNEPLLDSRIYEFIKRAKRKNLPVMVVTNGLLFNSKDVVTKLIEAKPDYIKISLQLLSPELFSRVRKAGYDFQKYKEGVCKFLAAADKSSSEITADIACNFLSGVKVVKKLLGLEYGDPTVYDTVDEIRADLKNFLYELQGYLPQYKYDSLDVDNFLNHVSSNYLREPGLKITDNISVKIKPFIYGRRIKEFFPVKRSKPCLSKILGVLADGSVVPCCMAYDDDLAFGNICREPLQVILERGFERLNNIRTKGTDLPLACRHCMGAPTRRGAALKNLINTFIRVKT